MFARFFCPNKEKIIIYTNPVPSLEDVWRLFKEIDLKFQETALRFQKTEHN